MLILKIDSSLQTISHAARALSDDRLMNLPRRQRVVCGMSGGIDSSATAAIISQTWDSNDIELVEKAQKN